MEDWLFQAIERERKNPTLPDLSTVDRPGPGKDEVIKSWKEGNIEGIFCFMPNTYCLGFVEDNAIRLLAIGKYEEALLSAHTGTRTNWAHWAIGSIKWLFEMADPDKLRAAGDPIPQQDSYTLYRGVCGKGPKRRVNGYSWTALLDKAVWFAKRFSVLYEDPAVYQVTVQEKDILAVYNGREEKEYILRLPLPARPKRIPMDIERELA